MLALAAVALLGPLTAVTDASSSTSTRLVHVAFLSPTRGVGLFASATTNRPSICALYTRPTDNGGKSFGARRAELVRTECHDGEALSAVAFDRAGVLFAYGPFAMSAVLSVAPDGTVVLALPGLPQTAQARFPSMATVESLRPGAGRWSETQVPCASGDYETELSIAPDGSRWLACAGEPSTGVQPKSLAISDGAGKRWTDR